MTAVLQAHFADYAAFHRTPGNKACHYLGIPLIVLASLTFLSRVTLLQAGAFDVTLAEVLLVVASAYYFTLDAPLAALMFVALAVLDGASRPLPLAWAGGLFVLGWAFQFLGHYAYEKKSPAFLKNMVHLLVGPLWIVAKVVGKA